MGEALGLCRGEGSVRVPGSHRGGKGRGGEGRLGTQAEETAHLCLHMCVVCGSSVRECMCTVCRYLGWQRNCRTGVCVCVCVCACVCVCVCVRVCNHSTYSIGWSPCCRRRWG